MTANATPVVFHYDSIGNDGALANAIETDPHNNYLAVFDALPFLGRNALQQHELVIRQVAVRAGDILLTMRLLGLLETQLADRDQVPAQAVASLAKTYFDATGTMLSLTTDEHQNWRVPATTFTMPAVTARSISLQARAESLVSRA